MNASYMKFTDRGLRDLTKADPNLDYECEIIQIHPKNIDFDTVPYSVIGFRMKLDRYRSKYILNYYVPTLVFVMASWSSFLVPPRIVPGRMALLITLLLVLINFFGTIIENQPPSQKTTAIVIWTISCGMFVFAALLAYSVLLLKLYKVDRPAGKKAKSRRSIKDFERILEQKLAIFDKFFIVCFPSAFFIFNVFYWLFYWPGAFRLFTHPENEGPRTNFTN